MKTQNHEPILVAFFVEPTSISLVRIGLGCNLFRRMNDWAYRPETVYNTYKYYYLSESLITCFYR